MRIALCLSGQPRTWKKCYQTWIDTFSKWGEIDFFCHLWDFNSDTNLVQYQFNLYEETKISNLEKKEILEALKPKKVVFQTKKDNFPEYSKAVINKIAPWSNSQFYGVWRCANLKRQYEIENDFEYDLVVRLRTDLIFGDGIELSNISPCTIYGCHSNTYDKEYEVPRFGDIFFFSDSLTYDHISMFYYSLKFIDASHAVLGKSKSYDFPPEIGFYYYLAMSGIKTKTLLNPNLKIVRSKHHELMMGLKEHETS